MATSVELVRRAGHVLLGAPPEQVGMREAARLGRRNAIRWVALFHIATDAGLASAKGALGGLEWWLEECESALRRGDASAAVDAVQPYVWASDRRRAEGMVSVLQALFFPAQEPVGELASPSRIRQFMAAHPEMWG